MEDRVVTKILIRDIEGGNTEVLESLSDELDDELNPEEISRILNSHGIDASSDDLKLSIAYEPPLGEGKLQFQDPLIAGCIVIAIHAGPIVGPAIGGAAGAITTYVLTKAFEKNQQENARFSVESKTITPQE